MTGMDLMMMPNAVGRDGIHLSVQLEMDAQQLRAHRIAWAAQTMETAANRIRELEDIIANPPTTNGDLPYSRRDS